MNHAERNAQAHYENITSQLLALAVANVLENGGDVRELPDVIYDQVEWRDDDTLPAQSITSGYVEVIIDNEGKIRLELEGYPIFNTDEVLETIDGTPLSVMIRGGWNAPGESTTEAEEYEILLTTGGPALRIRGDLNGWGKPDNARMEWQDWGTPWTQYHGVDQDVLTEWAGNFYFAE